MSSLPQHIQAKKNIRNRLFPSFLISRSAADIPRGEDSGLRPHSKPVAELGSDLHFLVLSPNCPTLSPPVPANGKSPPPLDCSSSTCTPGLLKFQAPLNFLLNKSESKAICMGFPGGAVVKNPPANAEDMGSSPGPGRSHMPRSN